MFPYFYRLKCLGEFKIAWKHLPYGLVITLRFPILPNFHLCFYNCAKCVKCFLFLNCHIKNKLYNLQIFLTYLCSFETIRGMYLKHVEFSSLKMMIRNWNTTVQWWMATYVYQPFPYRQKLVR